MARGNPGSEAIPPPGRGPLAADPPADWAPPAGVPSEAAEPVTPGSPPGPGAVPAAEPASATVTSSADVEGRISKRLVGPRPPQTTADAWSWLGWGLFGFVTGYVLSDLALVVVANANGHARDLSSLVRLAVPPAWVVICGLVGLWSGFLLAVVVASRRRGTGHVLRDMRWGFRWWDPLVGLVVGLLGQFVLLWLLYLPLSHVVPHLAQRLSEPAKHLTGGFPGSDVAIIAFLTVAAVPVIEELFFRGLVLRGFLRAFAGAGRILGPLLAVVATGIVFGAAHGEALEFLGLAVFGMVLAVLAWRFDRLGPSIFAHATFNLAAMVVVVYGGVVHAPVL